MSPCSSHFSASTMQSIRFAVQFRHPNFVVLQRAQCAPSSLTWSVLKLKINNFKEQENFYLSFHFLKINYFHKMFWKLNK